MAQGQEAIEQRLGFGLEVAVGYHIRVVVEEGDEERRAEEDQQAHSLGQQHRAEHSKPRAALDPVILPGAQVLAHEGRQTHDKAGHRQEGEALDLGIGAAAGHGVGAEGVDIGLDHYIGQTDDRVLDTRGQAEADDLPEHGLVEADLPQLHPVEPVGPDQLPDTQQGRNGLGNHRGGRRRGHAPAEHRHEQQVQRHIDKRGEN